jgi:pimeloyl-ACP methyl ester carboxylesterase
MNLASTVRSVAIFILVLVFCLPVSAAETIGIVLMHGKTGNSLPTSPTGLLAEKLRKAGFLVSTPDMPWSRSRYIEKDYDKAMAEIDSAIDELRRSGATKFVVAGHSLGANVALGYGARRAGLAGIIALAPGHTPESAEFQDMITGELDRAQSMINAGDSDKVAKFIDVVQSRASNVKLKPKIYLSWFSPKGGAVMPRNAAKLKPGTPLLWVVGEKDNMAKKGRSYAFDLAPPNRKNLYLEVSGGHLATPRVAAERIIEWLRGL